MLGAAAGPVGVAAGIGVGALIGIVAAHYLEQ